jgi:hypothetical protein
MTILRHLSGVAMPVPLPRQRQNRGRDAPAEAAAVTLRSVGCRHGEWPHRSVTNEAGRAERVGTCHLPCRWIVRPGTERLALVQTADVCTRASCTSAVRDLVRPGMVCQHVSSWRGLRVLRGPAGLGTGRRGLRVIAEPGKGGTARLTAPAAASVPGRAIVPGRDGLLGPHPPSGGAGTPGPRRGR